MNAPASARPRMVAGLRLVRLVGRGGEGEVWEARDERGRQRALKLIRPDALAPDAAARSQHLLAIDHPALVRVYDGGQLTGGMLDGWGYLEMDFVDGPSLHDAPADPAVLDRLWPLAEALDLLHAGEWTQGLALVHRDVKPANLVERPDGELVLVDPSTLRGIDATQLTRIGTPVFSAPEVMTGRFGPPADVYSFAATVVALLTGTRGEALAELLDGAHTLDLPPGVGYALSPVPGDRPAACRAVLQAGAELAEHPTLLLPALDGLDDGRQHTLIDHSRYSDLSAGDRGSEDLRIWEGAPEGSLAPGAGVLAPAPRPRGLWGLTWLLVLLLVGPAVAVASDLLAPDDWVLLAAGAAGLHLVAHLAAGGSLLAAVLVPPVAWAVLLGRRVQGGRRRRAWASAVLTAALAPATAGAVWALWQPTSPALEQALLGVAVSVGLVVTTVAGANARGGAAALLRLLLTPLWLAGAVVLVVGGLLLSPFGVARGMSWTTATSLFDGLRSPAMIVPPMDGRG